MVFVLAIQKVHMNQKYCLFQKVCELRQFTIYTNERDLFARTRTIQREICLLIDEWKHLNSILAVEYGQIYHELQQNQNKKKCRSI